MPHWGAQVLSAGMHAGLTYDETMWRTPYSVLLQLLHVEMVRNGATTRWSKGGADTVPDIAAIKSRRFKVEWQ